MYISWTFYLQESGLWKKNANLYIKEPNKFKEIVKIIKFLRQLKYFKLSSSLRVLIYLSKISQAWQIVIISITKTSTQEKLFKIHSKLNSEKTSGF
jgi:hypothetical protein